MSLGSFYQSMDAELGSMVAGLRRAKVILAWRSSKAKPYKPHCL
jgi:hypothetical protein